MPNESDFTEQNATLDRLRDAMEQAKALYDGAKEDYDCQLERIRDLGTTHPDGSIRQATRAFTVTLRAYTKALKDFNHYVLYQKVPEDCEP